MTQAREVDLKGWIVILTSTVGVAVSVIPVSILSMGVFMKPLNQVYGWGRGELSLALTIISLAMAVSLPIAGRLIDNRGVKVPMIISLILYGAGVAAAPMLLQNFGLAGFYGLALWVGIAGAPSSTVCYVKVLSRWFKRSRGLAMGFAMSGIALGGAITPLIAATLIESHGWQAGFYGLALLPLVIGMIVALTLREAPPSESNGEQIAAILPGMTMAEAMRTPIFWTLLLLFLIAATAIHGIQIHLAPLLSDLGLTPDRAALSVSYMFGVSVVFRLLAGYMFDKMFAPYVGALCFACAAIGTAMLFTISAPAGFVVAVALLGVGSGAESDLMGYLVSRYFGLRAYAAIFGWVFGALMVGSAIGPLLLGIGYDASGSYMTSLIWCTVGLVLTGIMLVLLPRYPEFDTRDRPSGIAPAAVPATH